MTEDERRADENERIDYAEGATAITDIQQRAGDAAALEGGPWRALEIEFQAHDATKAALAERDAEFEAYKRDVSKACNEAWDLDNFGRQQVLKHLSRFILPEPVDELVAAMRDACDAQGLATLHTPKELAVHLREALAKRGLTITERQP